MLHSSTHSLLLLFLKDLGFSFLFSPYYFDHYFSFWVFCRKKWTFLLKFRPATTARVCCYFYFVYPFRKKHTHTHTSFFYFYYSNIPMPRADNLVLTLNMYKHLEIEELSIIYKRNPCLHKRYLMSSYYLRNRTYFRKRVDRRLWYSRERAYRAFAVCCPDTLYKRHEKKA